MVFLSLEYSIGKKEGGTHQWNVSYKDVQYNWRVSLRSLVRANLLRLDVLSQIIVFQLWRYSLQPSLIFHQVLDHAAHPPGLLFSTARRRILAYPNPHDGERNLLHHLLLRPDLPVLPT